MVKWATDAPDDVASQVTNCFASDFCSEDAKDSDAWQNTGNGFAVSPDNIVDHFDSPATGGPYGFNERMVFRGQRFRPVFQWQPTPGSLAVTGVVTNDGSPIANAEVVVEGFSAAPVITDGSGRFKIEGVPRGNIMVHAQEFVGPVATGELREGEACFVPSNPSDLTSQTLRLVDCHDFTHFLDSNVYTDVTIALQPPPDDFRDVTFSGGFNLEDCDCCGFDTCPDFATRTFLKVCHVSPLQPEDDVHVGQNDLCDDEVGVDFAAHCSLQSDRRTVHVTGTFKFYEATSNTCGATDQEDSGSFDEFIAAGGSAPPFLQNLENSDVCISPLGLPFDCTDTAEFSGFGIQNNRSP